MEELNLENLIFGEKEEIPPKPMYVHWILLALALVIAVVITAFWPKGQGDIHGEPAPDMISWRGADSDLAGQLYRFDIVVFTPRLDPSGWNAEKISFGVKSENGYFMTNISSASPNTLTVDSGKSATWLPGEGTSLDYVVFTAWAGEHIVGYAVAKVRPAVVGIAVGEPLYTAEILESVTFPLIDGEFQDVTEEYISQQIEELKQE